MIKKLQEFIENVRKEMAKVSWPTREELLNSSIIVVVVSLIFTIYIFLSDVIISRVVELFY